MDHRNLNDLRVVDLKKELEIRGLSKSGSKKDLIDRLKAQMAIEQLRGSSMTSEGDAPSLQVAGDEENEFVKNYLRQRQKLLSQQMEQKKKFEEEASLSQSECEIDEGNAGESQNAQSDVVNESDDDTDVDSNPEMSTQQINAPVNPIDYNAKTLPVDQPNLKDKLDVASSSQIRSVVDDDNGTENSSNRHEASSFSPKRRSRSRSRSRSSHESSSHHSNRSSRSRSKTNSQSRSRSRSDNSRSSSREKSVVRSRSPSEEITFKGNRNVKVREMSKSESSDRSRSPSVEKFEKMETSAVEPDRSILLPSSSLEHERSESSGFPSETKLPVIETTSVACDESGSLSLTKLPVLETASVECDRSKSPLMIKLPALDTCSVEPVRFEDKESDLKTVTDVFKPTELCSDAAVPIISDAVKLDSNAAANTQEKKGIQVNDKEEKLQEDNDQSKSQNEVFSKSQSETVSKGDVSSECTKPVRKRRWGSASVQTVKPSINISTDSLKGLIPEVDPGSISMETVMEFEETGDLLIKDQKESYLETATRSVIVTDTKENESTENGDTRAAKMRRTVYQESASSDVDKTSDLETKEVKKIEEESDAGSIRLVKAPVVPPVDEVSKKIDDGNRQVRLNRTVSLTVEDPVDVGRRSPSPARHPPSNVVHVTGLVRPYTLGQLKELLGRTGTLQPDGFWIDNIKSHCYVVYETMEQATATRKALHGKRWPATNPKLLGVDFRTMDEFEKRKNNIVVREITTAAPVPTDQVGKQLQPIENKREQEKARNGNESVKDMKKPPRDVAKPPIKENKDKSGGVVPVREWDRHKLRQSRSLSQEKQRKDDKAKAEARDKKETNRQDQQRSRDERRGRNRMDKSETGAKVEEEPPAKLLDDLFRKTVAMPCIYWLPLTDEQANEKMAQEKQEKLLRDQRRAERDQQLEVERQQRLKAHEDRVRQDHSRTAERDRQPAQRRKQFSEADDSLRKRARSRSGGRANRR